MHNHGLFSHKINQQIIQNTPIIYGNYPKSTTYHGLSYDIGLKKIVWDYKLIRIDVAYSPL